MVKDLSIKECSPQSLAGFILQYIKETIKTRTKNVYQLEINHLLYDENAKEEDKDEGRAEQEKVPLHWSIIPLPGSKSIMPGQCQCSGTPLLRRECCPTETQQPSIRCYLLKFELI